MRELVIAKIEQYVDFINSTKDYWVHDLDINDIVEKSDEELVTILVQIVQKTSRL